MERSIQLAIVGASCAVLGLAVGYFTASHEDIPEEMHHIAHDDDSADVINGAKEVLPPRAAASDDATASQTSTDVVVCWIIRMDAVLCFISEYLRGFMRRPWLSFV